jgi:hypothetical protein
MKRTSYLAISLTLVLLINSLSCNLLQKMVSAATPAPAVKTTHPEPPPAQPSQVSPNGEPTVPAAQEHQPNAYYEGISFYYDPALAKGVQANTLLATEPVSDDQPPFTVNPTTYQFLFQGYLLKDTSHQAEINIYPVKEYERLDKENITPIISSLQKLLSDRPQTASGDLPLLPIWNAAQVFHSQLKYVRFQNGEGIRYITEYGQDIAPMNNNSVFYTFQGITSDGAYYVSAIFPINHPSLPANYDEGMKGRNYEEFANNYMSYITDLQKQLNDEKEDSFNPQLTRLDAVIQTLKVNK